MSHRIHDRAKIQVRDLREGRSTAEDDVRNVPGKTGSWMKGVFSVRIIEMDLQQLERKVPVRDRCGCSLETAFHRSSMIVLANITKCSYVRYS